MAFKYMYPWSTMTIGGKKYDLFGRFNTLASARAKTKQLHRMGRLARVVGRAEGGEYLVYDLAHTKPYDASQEYYCYKCKNYHDKSSKIGKSHISHKRK